MVLRELPYLPDWASFLIFFLGQQKPCQAITSFIDAWVILSFGTDVVSQGTIIQTAILNAWITPQNHKLLTWLHIVILKCKDERKTQNRRVIEVEKCQSYPNTKGASNYEKQITKWKIKCYSVGFFFSPYLQNHTFKTQPHKRIPFNCVDVYVILNVSRRKYRQIRYLHQLYSCNLPTFSLTGMMWSLAEVMY